MNSSAPDPLELSTALIARPSVTPEDAGALDVLIEALEPLGFVCHDLTFDDPAGAATRNLYARLGTAGPNFCFAGHTDVVPPGERADWTSDPFAPEVRGGRLYGRGAADMKCAVAAMATAVARFLDGAGAAFGGSISFLITGDEEGDATNGTPKVLGWLADRGERLDACLVGEPTNPEALGDMVKIGRRGSMNVRLAVTGVQGHAAYPDLADNPIPRLLKLLAAANDVPLDDGNAHFPASRVTITTVDVGNAATNVIPPRAEARFNVRFNDIWTGASLEEELRRRLDAAAAGAYEMQVSVSGESFLTPPGLLSDVVAQAVEDVTGRAPELSTTGGTSDARFIKDFCPVVEFGLINQTAHKVDENAPVDAVEDLARIYQSVLERFFRGRPLMPSLAEVLRQLWGAWRLARGDAKGVVVFGDDVRAFWQSFTAALIVLPLFFVMLWLMPGWAGEGGEGKSARFWLAELATYANLWVAFPFVMLPLARVMQREHRYIRFICAYNWSSVLQSALQCFILVLAGGGLLPPEGEQLLSLIAFIAILLYAWFIAKTALDITPLQAVGVVFLDFVIGTVVQAVGEGLKLA